MAQISRRKMTTSSILTSQSVVLKKIFRYSGMNTLWAKEENHKRENKAKRRRNWNKGLTLSQVFTNPRCYVTRTNSFFFFFSLGLGLFVVFHGIFNSALKKIHDLFERKKKF